MATNERERSPGVMPAKAGIQTILMSAYRVLHIWIPAFAGMTADSRSRALALAWQLTNFWTFIILYVFAMMISFTLAGRLRGAGRPRFSRGFRGDGIDRHACDGVISPLISYFAFENTTIHSLRLDKSLRNAGLTAAWRP